MGKQLPCFGFKDDQDATSGEGKLVISKHTDLLEFGNRYDILIVRGDVVRGVSLLECDNKDVAYFNNNSPNVSK